MSQDGRSISQQEKLGVPMKYPPRQSGECFENMLVLTLLESS